MKEDSQENPQDLYHPIFLAINSKNPMAVKDIIEKDPLALKQTLPESGYTPILLAIHFQNLQIINAIIEKDSSVIEQTLPSGTTPIFLAIASKNPEAVKMIIEKDSSVLEQTLPSGISPIFLATLKYCMTSESNKDNESAILKIIIQNQFKENITEETRGDLEEFFLNKLLLNGLYSKKKVGLDFSIFKSIFEKIILENSFDKINKIYKELFENVDEKKPIKFDDNDKMFIFSSHLDEHQSFFIFHVDDSNKLGSISYCDGNYIDKELKKIEDSETHIFGITTFHLENSIEYSDQFAQDFIEKNTKNKSTDFFYKKFKNQEIEKVKINYSKTTHSIPTKIQKRGNCTFKSTSLLARKILEKQDSSMVFDFDEITQKPFGSGHDEYKKFKTNLIKKNLDSILKFKEKISQKSDLFSEYLKKEIEDILEGAKKFSEAKNSSIFYDSEKEIKSKFSTLELELTELGEKSISKTSSLEIEPAGREEQSASSSILSKKEQEEASIEQKSSRVSCVPFFVKCLFLSDKKTHTKY